MTESGNAAYYPPVDAGVTGRSSRTQLREDAAAYIRELIVSGQTTPGMRLPLAELAEQIDTSVTPVREALLLLVQDGWVIQEPNRGFRVAAIRRRDVADAYLVFSWAASELTARSAAVVGPEAIARLRELDDAMQHPDLRAEGLDRLNLTFHTIIYDAAESLRLQWFVNAASRFVPRRFWGMIPGWYEFNRTSHRPIVDALEAHDVELSRRLAGDHILQAGNLLLAHLDAIAYWRDEAEVVATH